eukprot:CAMPEP_0184243450 /NCGR_PEP_ID=MMETSP0977-20130417/269_1 /TAXON_ID=483370 /ORGANISM="non described non described, Strain CCMP2097" /LENGTH=39 /DNA_ID= /DNA_START= /DNA_END= /DNA_ORIENTATION=
MAAAGAAGATKPVAQPTIRHAIAPFIVQSFWIRAQLGSA